MEDENKEMEAFDKELQKIFETRDIKKLEDSARKACERSIKDRLEAKKNREYKFKTQGITLCLSALLLLSVVSLRVENNNNKDKSSKIAYETIEETEETEEKDVIDSIKDYMSKNSLDSELNMHNLSKKIGSTINGKNESILKQCTFTVPSGYAYNLMNAAGKICFLDKDIQTYAICATLYDMGINRENYIEEAKATNEDFLIKNIKLLKISDENITDEEKEFWEDIESAKDYYKKIGAVDKKNNPSFEIYKNMQDENAEVILEIVKQMLNNDKGVTK